MYLVILQSVVCGVIFNLQSNRIPRCERRSPIFMKIFLVCDAYNNFSTSLFTAVFCVMRNGPRVDLFTVGIFDFHQLDPDKVVLLIAGKV